VGRPPGRAAGNKADLSGCFGVRAAKWLLGHRILFLRFHQRCADSLNLHWLLGGRKRCQDVRSSRKSLSSHPTICAITHACIGLSGDLGGTGRRTLPVPEPSTFALLGFGAVGLIGYGLRWRLSVRSH
jgi:hypothetical protein